MISYWGVDHGDEVSKGMKKAIAIMGGAGAGLGAGTGYAVDAHKKKDAGYRAQMEKDPKKRARNVGLGSGIATGLLAGPVVGAGFGVGAGGATYLANRKKKQPS